MNEVLRTLSIFGMGVCLCFPEIHASLQDQLSEAWTIFSVFLEELKVVRLIMDQHSA
jgi:hypothetical protein